MEVILPILIIIVVAAKFLNWMEKKPLNKSQDQQAPVSADSGSWNDFLNISQKLISSLNSHNIKYTVSEEGTLYQMLFKVENTEVDIYTRIEKEGAFVKFTAVLYYDIPDSKMIKVSELVTRLNEDLILGHFNLYYDLRMLVYDTVVILEDVEMTTFMLESNIGHCMKIPGKYGPLFKRVIENDEEPLLVLIDFYNQPEPNINSSSG